MLNWETVTDAEICEEMSQILKELRENKSGCVEPIFIIPESSYRLLSFEKRMTKVQKGPGKGRNGIVYVMRRG